MAQCQLQSLIQGLNPATNGIPAGAVQTWQPSDPKQDLRQGRSRPEHQHYSFPKSELRKFIEELHDDTLRGLLLPTCNCDFCKRNMSSAMFNVNVIAAKYPKAGFPVSYLKELILKSYLSTFVWLIANGIPWYILYLLHNEAEDTPNASAKTSLDRFNLGVLDASQKPQRSYKDDRYRIESCMGGVKFVLYIDEQRARKSKTGVLDDEKYRTLMSSHPQYFMKDLFSERVHRFEDHDSVPILAEIKKLDRKGGEASIYFVNIEGNEVLPQATTSKSRPFVLKTFIDRAQGVREWCAVMDAILILSKASVSNILTPLSAFFYRNWFCILYPRGICSLEEYLTCTKPSIRPKFEITPEKLWHQLTKIATTLGLLHDNGHYHLDLTLANLLIFDNGALMIGDFGEMGVPSPSPHLSLIKKLGVTDLETYPGELNETRIGNPLTRTLSDEFRSQNNNTKEGFQLQLKSYDLGCFGRICFEAAAYTTLGLPRSKLYMHLNEERDPSIRLGSFYQRCEPTRTLLKKPIVDRLLNELALATYPLGSPSSENIQSVEKSRERIDYRKLSNIIGNLISPDIKARLDEGFELGNKLLQCFPRRERPLHNTVPIAKGTAPAAPEEVSHCYPTSLKKSRMRVILEYYKRAKKLQTPGEAPSKCEIAVKEKGFHRYPSAPRWLRFLRPRPSDPPAAMEMILGVPGEEEVRDRDQSLPNLIDGEFKSTTRSHTTNFVDGETVGCLPRMASKLITRLHAIKLI
ncbi:uncharacterized protein DFL_004678 [Arthrobotrys flagrans]|uniref:Protein kinase domain-containing protein n=1 Tax=Arthrobotrys flagrans TaxID=97331 RepID=A0A437A5K3_ARTFL|nr:hypothetical protein DFL_004678 [Arthrobotrys flagrans]